MGSSVRVDFNPGLRRYLLATFTKWDGSWGLYNAPSEPWGPWTTVATYDRWLDDTPKFGFTFSQKWIVPTARRCGWSSREPSLRFVQRGEGDDSTQVTGVYTSRDASEDSVDNPLLASLAVICLRVIAKFLASASRFVVCSVTPRHIPPAAGKHCREEPQKEPNRRKHEEESQEKQTRCKGAAQSSCRCDWTGFGEIPLPEARRQSPARLQHTCNVLMQVAPCISNVCRTWGR